ncbi:MAG: hypothetical protein KDD82_04580 [Planctomycetes bacterium]|nr:hypothetical protein [Planctomycetota bacterium]
MNATLFKRCLVLALFTAALTAVGCNNSSNRRSASTTAATTSSNNGSVASTNSTTNAGPGPQLASVSFMDADQSNSITAGDRLVARFNGELAPISSGNSIRPELEFSLAVFQDSFGMGARLAPTSRSNEVEIVLGQGAVLHVSGAFSLGVNTPGSASGLNVSPYGTGQLVGTDGGPVRAASEPLDIDGTLTSGFVAVDSLNVPRGGHTSILLDDGRVLVVGGRAAGGDRSLVAEAEVYDPLADAWSLVTDLSGDAGRMRRGKVDVRMTDATLVALQDGTVLVSGGFGIERKGFFGLGKEKVDTLESAFVFNPADNSFKQVGDMQYPRHSHTATVMDDGRVLIAGGYNDSMWKKDKTQAPFEIYDPAKGQFEKVGSFIKRFKSREMRMGHTATAIEGQTGILLVGGNFYKGGGLFGLIKPKLQMTKGTEVVRGTSTDDAGALSAPRLDHAAASLGAQGKVLIAGGHDTQAAISMLEVYDEKAGTWSTAGNLTTPRSCPVIAVDRDLALIVGGFDGAAESNTAEVFDTVNNTLMGNSYTLTTARTAHTATALKDGRILIVGGMSGSTQLNGSDGQAIGSAEMFVRQ